MIAATYLYDSRTCAGKAVIRLGLIVVAVEFLFSLIRSVAAEYETRLLVACPRANITQLLDLV